MNTSQHPTTVGHAILARLREAGIEYFLANAGTDFPPIIEAFAQTGPNRAGGPEPMVVPHENVAIAMAHGYAMVSGKPLAVMLHVNVGTSNAICGLTNAYRMNIPLLLMAGRTPLTEHGSVAGGTRSRHIHWAQEMFDQAGMLRELVKWDYELRAPSEVDVVIDRAISLTTSPSRGPVYLTIPREVLSAPAATTTGPLRAAPSGNIHPDPAQLKEAAKLLTSARNPLIITSDTGRSTAAAADLAALAERFAIPVITHVPRYLNLPDSHPMHLGYEASPHLAEADVILTLDADVPWIPATDPIDTDAKVIQIAEDPLYTRYPVRGFPAALSIAADTAVALKPLAEAMSEGDPAAIESRRNKVSAIHDEIVAGWQQFAERAGQATPIQAAHLSACVGAVAAEHDAILVNEMGIPPQFAGLRKPGSYFGPSPAGGLGWGLGAALGAKLAARDKLVIATVGDGSYFFGNPLAAHHCSRAYDLPVLFVITDNGGWGAVRRATRAMYPDGSAVGGNQIPLSRLDPAPDYEKVIGACGGYGERVSDPDDLPAALERALHAVTVERRQALLNVICAEG
jgi:acetolactate synthase-1/2/3 large subunit